MASHLVTMDAKTDSAENVSFGNVRQSVLNTNASSEAFLVVVPTRNRGSSRPMISVLFVLCFCSIQWAITTYTAILTLPFKFESRMNNYIDHKNVSLIRSSWKIESGPQNGRKLRYATQQKKAPQVVEWGIPQWLHLRDWKCFYIRKIEIIVSSYEHDHVLANIGQGSLKSPGFENLRALVQEITVRNSHSSMKKQNKIWSVGGFGICSQFWNLYGRGLNLPQIWGYRRKCSPVYLMGSIKYLFCSRQSYAR